MEDRYEFTERLGSGTFGEVFKAASRATGEVVAVKRLKRTFTDWAEAKQLREVQACANLKHPNVCRIKELVLERGTLYFVFEFLETTLLAKMSAAGGALPIAAIRKYCSQVLAGLAFTHKHGFFHRDIKPENLLCRGDTVKLADFGEARAIRAVGKFTPQSGTLWYRAPEMLLETRYSSPVDIWAVGCIMAELLLGRPLFPGKTPMAQLYEIANVLGPPPSSWSDGQRAASSMNFNVSRSAGGMTPLSELLDGVDRVGVSLVMDLLQWDPNRRPTARQALAHPFFEGEPATRPYSTPASTPSGASSMKFNHTSDRKEGKEDDESEAKLTETGRPSVSTAPAAAPVLARGSSFSSAPVPSPLATGGPSSAAAPSTPTSPWARRDPVMLGATHGSTTSLDSPFASSIDKAIGQLGLDVSVETGEGAGGGTLTPLSTSPPPEPASAKTDVLTESTVQAMLEEMEARP